MANELMNLAGFKSGPAKAFAGHFTEESLADGIGGGYPLIRYGGKVWAIQIKGDETKYVTPDGYGAPYIDVVILRQARHKSKAYFPNWEEGSKDAPVCSSLDGVVPDPGVEERQNATCSGCPRNVFKPNEKGIKVKECGDAKRLAVIPMPAQTAKLLGQALVEPVFLRVPAASLQGLAQMGDAAKKQGYAYFAFITRIDFDPEKAYPKMRFNGVQELSDTEAAKILELREDPQAYRIVTGDVSGGVKQVAQGPAQPAVTFKPAPAGAPATIDVGLTVTANEVDPDAAAKAALAAKFAADRAARLAAVQAEAAAIEAETVAAAAPAPKTKAAPVTLDVKPNPPAPAPTATVETGLTAGLSTTAATTAAPTTTVAQASSPVSSPASVDTGEPEQSDAALDAAIEALIPK